MHRIKNFIDVLSKLKQNFSFEDIKEELRESISFLDPEQLYIAEEEMIEFNIDVQSIKMLISECIKNISVKNSKTMNSLSKDHPIRLFLNEHEHIINILEELRKKNYILKHSSEFELIKNTLNEIELLVIKLIEFEKHEEKEERLIFPKLEKFGIISHPYIMRLEHQEISESRKELLKLCKKLNQKNSIDTSKKIISLVRNIINKMNDNIFEENSIIYPLAIESISFNEWEEIKKNFN